MFFQLRTRSRSRDVVDKNNDEPCRPDEVEDQTNKTPVGSVLTKTRALWLLLILISVFNLTVPYR